MLPMTKPTYRTPAPQPDAGLRARQCGRIATGALFLPGATTITDTAWAALSRAGVDLGDVLRRHCAADWSNMMPHDRQANIEALARGGRIFSSFQLDERVRVWVITEADRSSTSVLLPGEY